MHHPLMQLTKRVLATLKAPYPLGVLMLEGQPCVAFSTEDHGPVMLAAPPYREGAQITSGPGGCMALVAEADELYAIMGCFPGYKFQTGALWRIRREAGLWTSSKIADLPFAHRIDFVTRGGTRYLLAASLAVDKADPADWSTPGSLYACRVPRNTAENWELVPVLEGIHRNHGLLVTRFMGRPSVLVSGSEGLFAADLGQSGSMWAFSRIMEEEISEVAVADVDGDGEDELVTIQPFHGNSLRVYTMGPGGWKQAWESELEFGHGLTTGKLGGVVSILVSNRTGSRDLLLFQFPRRGKDRAGVLAEPLRSVVDPGAGAANTLILSHDGVERIFATNQAAGEIAEYRAAH